jgi:hypothetical protein
MLSIILDPVIDASLFKILGLIYWTREISKSVNSS